VSEPVFHHVSVITRNVEHAKTFYKDVLGLAEVERPPFPHLGAWLRSGSLEIHITYYLAGTFRDRPVDPNDIHFAIRVPDFEQAVSRLARNGYVEGGEPDNPKRIVIKRDSVTGYPQLWVMDHDRNVIEINAAGL
jgi:catechol 2,3-dioxygenase-like lactoylglutathione lyase family enzyme